MQGKSWFLVALVMLAAATMAPAASAHGPDGRIWVSTGSVMHWNGHPFHRQHRYPLHRTQGPRGVRYFYYAADPWCRHPAYRQACHGYPTYPGYPGHYLDQQWRAPSKAPSRRPGYHRHRPGY